MPLRDYRAHVEWTGDLHSTRGGKGRAPPDGLNDPTSWLALVASQRRRANTATLPRWARSTA